MRLFITFFILPIFSFAIQFFEYYDRSHDEKNKCAEYYSYSTLPNSGRGIYAGISYRIGELTGDLNPAILIPRDKMPNTQPHFYDFSSGSEDTSLLILGPGSILNHNDPPSISHGWADNTVPLPKDSLRTFKHGAYYYDTFEAIVDIEEGEEIFNYYGANWFDSHQHSAATIDEEVSIDGSALSITSSELPSGPLAAICITDVEVAPSFLPPYQINSDTDEGVFVSPGYGLFAKRAFKQGELILAVPLLFLPAEVIESLEEHESEIVSYSLYEEGSRVYLVPMGVGVMMNHYRSLTSIMRSKGGREDESRSEGAANVHLQWFDFWEHFPCATDGSGDCSFPRHNVPYALQSMLSKSVKELLEMKMAPLDIGYYAARDIEAGEELLIDYGEGWEEYMREFLQGQEVVPRKEGEDEEVFRREYIRHPIGLGKGSMPEHWLGHTSPYLSHNSESTSESLPDTSSNYLQQLREKVRKMIG
eukprot:gene13522-14871_t